MRQKWLQEIKSLFGLDRQQVFLWRIHPPFKVLTLERAGITLIADSLDRGSVSGSDRSTGDGNLE